MYAIDFIDQFAYGIGYVAYTIILMRVAQQGQFKTSHFAIGTGLGALCIAIAGIDVGESYGSPAGRAAIVGLLAEPAGADRNRSDELSDVWRRTAERLALATESGEVRPDVDAHLRQVVDGALVAMRPNLVKGVINIEGSQAVLPTPSQIAAYRAVPVRLGSFSKASLNIR